MSLVVKPIGNTYSRIECSNCNSIASYIFRIEEFQSYKCSCDSNKCLKIVRKYMEEKVQTLAPKKSTTPEKRKRETSDEIDWHLYGWGESRLKGLSTADLVKLCKDRDLPKSGSKGILAARLIEWVNNGYSAPEKKRSKTDEYRMICGKERKDGTLCPNKAKEGEWYCGKHM